MIEFTMGIAGRVVAVCANYESTMAFCAEYLCQDVPDFSVRVTPSDILRERQLLARQNPEEGAGHRDYPDTYLETIALHRKITECMFDYDTLMFHGSAVAVDGVGYLFAAPSGTGKSTHARLWRQLLGDRAVMINDDKPLLRMTDGQVLACGTPWNGKHRLGTNTSVPLRAICLLERDEENCLYKISPREALVALLHQSNRPADPAKMPRYMELLDRLAKGVSFYRLRCNMDLEAAQLAYSALTKQ